MPYGGGFAFNNVQEMPVVIGRGDRTRTSASSGRATRACSRRTTSTRSFDQNIPSLRWDSRDRFLQGTAGQAPGSPSGYTNGNGPNDGTMAMPPSNSPEHLQWHGHGQAAGQDDRERQLLGGEACPERGADRVDDQPRDREPHRALLPGLKTLPRETADLHVNYTTAMMNISSRPIKDVTLAARYRFNSRSDFRRPFDAVEYVRDDAVPEETGGASEAFNINRNMLDVTAKFTQIPKSALKVGYTEEKLGARRPSRPRAGGTRPPCSFDTVGNQYVTLRAQYAHTNARPSVSRKTSSSRWPCSGRSLTDEAARKTDRATFMVDVTPHRRTSTSRTFLRQGRIRGTRVNCSACSTTPTRPTPPGVNYAPSAKVSVGGDYGYEKFDAFQASRTANPFSGVPRGVRELDRSQPRLNVANDEKVTTFTAYLVLLDVLKKTDIRATYEGQRSTRASCMRTAHHRHDEQLHPDAGRCVARHGEQLLHSPAERDQHVEHFHRRITATTSRRSCFLDDLLVSTSPILPLLLNTAGPQTLPRPTWARRPPRPGWAGFHQHWEPAVHGKHGIRADVLRCREAGGRQRRPPR